MFATMRRKQRSTDMKSELGQGVDHFKRAASLAAQETTATVKPKLSAAKDRVQPAASKAKDAASGGWESAVATITPLVAAAGDGPRGVADLVNISSTAGRVARPGTAVYTLTKFGVDAFSEALRQEVLEQNVRVGVVEPGTVDTELGSHNRDGVRESIQQQTTSIERLQPEDIADAVTYMVTRDRRVAVNEMLVRAAAQTW